MNETGLPRTILWRRLDQPGFEYCRLAEHFSGWQLLGTAVFVADTRPQRVNYQLTCDSKWQTRRVKIGLDYGSLKKSLDMTVDRQLRWWSAGQELTLLRGCFDVGLNCTPAVNTLPVRRLKLAVGRSARITVAWIQFPGVTVIPLSQRYTRLSHNRYRYENGTGPTVANIEVDQFGLTRCYSDGWERVV